MRETEVDSGEQEAEVKIKGQCGDQGCRVG